MVRAPSLYLGGPWFESMHSHMNNIVVLTGGDASEREVSLRTAETITTALDALGHSCSVIDVANQNWEQELSDGAIALIALHGSFGEDGTLQSILEKRQIRFTGSGSEASRIAFDKNAAKIIVRKLHIHCPTDTDPSDITAATFPLVVKPVQEGSSYGVSIVRSQAELAKATSAAQKYGQQIMFEEYIKGKEVSCAVTEISGEAKALPVIEIEPHADFFDYESKYSSEGAKETVPAKIDSDLTEKIQLLSETIFKEMNLRQYARIDWIIKDRQPYFLEVNTLPGMTPTSLLNKELDAARVKMTDFVNFLIKTARYD